MKVKPLAVMHGAFLPQLYPMVASNASILAIVASHSSSGIDAVETDVM
jgi:hypothetical protein